MKSMIKQKRGFTIIELIVVIAVIGILVLLAAPKFLGYTADAKMAQMRNDINAVEKTLSSQMTDAEARGEEYLASLAQYPNDKVEEHVSDGRLFNKKGQVDAVTESVFYSVPDKDVNSAGSKLKGDFIADGQGAVYYVNKGTSDSAVEDVYVAKDEDFTWNATGTTEAGYSAAGKDEIGYYSYIGDEKIVEIPHEINGHKMKSYFGMFAMNSNVEKVVSTNTDITDMTSMFTSAQLEKLDLSKLKTEGVTNMMAMFAEANIQDLNLTGFDTSNVRSMENMFSGTYTEELDLTGFDTSSLEEVEMMFFRSKVPSLNLNGWDTSNITNMFHMFKESEAKSLKLNGWDTGNVTNMSSMFYKSHAKELDLSDFNTSSVEDISYMFSYSHAKELDLSNFTTDNVVKTERIFEGSKALRIDLSGWHVNTFNNHSNQTVPVHLFANSHVKELDLSPFDWSSNRMSESTLDTLFKNSIVTKVYVKTQEDANILNSIIDKPNGFIAEKK